MHEPSSPPDGPRAPQDGDRRVGRRTCLGISSILVGIGAVVLANQTKLTATKLLLGGFYVKDEYREVLLYAGVALAVFGGLLVILAAARSAEPVAVSSLSAVTGLLLILTLAGGGLIYAAYKHAQQNAANGTGSNLGLQPAQSTPASVSTQASDYPSPCTLYLSGHDAQLTLSGPDASSDCASFAGSATSTGQIWTTTAEQATGTLAEVCDLASGSDEMVVNDDGGQVYGSQACNTFSAEGWLPASQSSSSSTNTVASTTAQPATPTNTAAGGSLPVLATSAWSGIKPSSIDFSADGGNIVTQISWSSWTPTSAVGEGTSDIQSCVPNCAQGTNTSVPTEITLSKPHDLIFEQLTESRTGQTTTYSYTSASWPMGAS